MSKIYIINKNEIDAVTKSVSQQEQNSTCTSVKFDVFKILPLLNEIKEEEWTTGACSR